MAACQLPQNFIAGNGRTWVLCMYSDQEDDWAAAGSHRQRCYLINTDRALHPHSMHVL